MLKHAAAERTLLVPTPSVLCSMTRRQTFPCVPTTFKPTPHPHSHTNTPSLQLSEHEKALKEFRCGACHSTLKDPLSTPCGTYLCGRCGHTGAVVDPGADFLMDCIWSAALGQLLCPFTRNPKCDPSRFSQSHHTSKMTLCPCLTGGFINP